MVDHNFNDLLTTLTFFSQFVHKLSISDNSLLSLEQSEKRGLLAMCSHAPIVRRINVRYTVGGIPGSSDRPIPRGAAWGSV